MSKSKPRQNGGLVKILTFGRVDNFSRSHARSLLQGITSGSPLSYFTLFSLRSYKPLYLFWITGYHKFWWRWSHLFTVPECQRNTHLLQRKKITEHSLFSSTYSYISSSINCFSNSWCISRGMWIKNIFIHLYHQSKSIYGDQGLRNNSLKLRYDFSCFCAKKRNTRQWVFR